LVGDRNGRKDVPAGAAAAKNKSVGSVWFGHGFGVCVESPDASASDGPDGESAPSSVATGRAFSREFIMIFCIMPTMMQEAMMDVPPELMNWRFCPVTGIIPTFTPVW